MVPAEQDVPAARFCAIAQPFSQSPNWALPMHIIVPSLEQGIQDPVTTGRYGSMIEVEVEVDKEP